MLLKHLLRYYVRQIVQIKTWRGIRGLGTLLESRLRFSLLTDNLLLDSCWAEWVLVLIIGLLKGHVQLIYRLSLELLWWRWVRRVEHLNLVYLGLVWPFEVLLLHRRSMTANLSSYWLRTYFWLLCLVCGSKEPDIIHVLEVWYVLFLVGREHVWVICVSLGLLK